MIPVTVSASRHYVDRGWPAICARVQVAGERYDLSYRATRGPLTTSADPFLAAALLPAMVLGAPLHIAGSVSPRILQSVSQVQEIMSTWYKELHTIPIVALPGPPAEAQAGDIACFYSGGVDSSYSILKNQAELSHLIFVHGFDIRLSDTHFRQKVAAALQEAAGEWHKPLIEVETNVRDLLDVYTDWDSHAHGAAMASVALALSPQFSRVYFGSTFAYDSLMPLGLHPLLDPLWSTEHMEIVHDGCEASRWQKLEHIMGSPTVRRHLRSCWQHPDGAYNCGHCRGCLRILAFLLMMGLEGQCATFNYGLDLNELAHMPLVGPRASIITEDLLRFGESRNAEPAVLAALRAALARWQVTGPDGVVQELADKRRRVARLQTRLNKMTLSRSWRSTARLRDATAALRRLKRPQ